MNLKRIVQEVLINYPLPIHGDHGVAHWARVLENGRRLSDLTKANLTVVSLFAVLHDSRRINEFQDPFHGLRGADLAATLRGRLFDISDDEFQLLYLACEGQTAAPASISFHNSSVRTGGLNCRTNAIGESL
ncbi:MAG: hypothetical protein JWP89_221 [Schlesneria sp.]|nr:hypothetical protein [Schlesneria sp.]